eukprot:765453-Hanusia_phi.AAC.3
MDRGLSTWLGLLYWCRRERDRAPCSEADTSMVQYGRAQGPLDSPNIPGDANGEEEGAEGFPQISPSIWMSGSLKVKSPSVLPVRATRAPCCCCCCCDAVDRAREARRI